MTKPENRIGQYESLLVSLLTIRKKKEIKTTRENGETCQTDDGRVMNYLCRPTTKDEPSTDFVARHKWTRAPRIYWKQSACWWNEKAIGNRSPTSTNNKKNRGQSRSSPSMRMDPQDFFIFIFPYPGIKYRPTPTYVTWAPDLDGIWKSVRTDRGRESTWIYFLKQTKVGQNKFSRWMTLLLLVLLLVIFNENKKVNSLVL